MAESRGMLPGARLSGANRVGQTRRVLELRPNCECCDRDLPADSPEAMICSYECTWCRDCVDHVLQGVCPNCGGGLTPRPIRPHARLLKDPASSLRVARAACP